MKLPKGKICCDSCQEHLNDTGLIGDWLDDLHRRIQGTVLHEAKTRKISPLEAVQRVFIKVGDQEIRPFTGEAIEIDYREAKEIEA